MPQLQINQGPQDALLFDNTRSYFTNVGYVRTSNFQVEYRDIDAQNGNGGFGSTLQFVVPKAADLLGPLDLRLTIDAPTFTGVGNNGNSSAAGHAAWVDELGFAMIEKITFSVGSNDIETITGEMLQLKNELMTSDEQRLGYDTILKTGKSVFSSSPTKQEQAIDETTMADTGVTVKRDLTRLLVHCPDTSSAPVLASARTITVPLGLFFTKHVSQYFPLAAVAGCNDVRIAIKLRTLSELLQVNAIVAPSVTMSTPKLRGHFVHVTGPEAQVLMNKEHVRLLKLYQHDRAFFPELKDTWSMDLSFLHPVTTLLITIRRVKDMTTEVTGTNKNAKQKGFFFFHGDGTNPNFDAAALAAGDASTDKGAEDAKSINTVKLNSIQLKLNGQERHPGLPKGIEVDYLKSRLIPMLHSNSNSVQEYDAAHGGSKVLKQLQGAPNIFVYPFSLNPEGSNPAGSVNMSKVSHAKLELHMQSATLGSDNTGVPIKCPSGAGGGYVVDVYALYWNWLQIKDGRALLSFA